MSRYVLAIKIYTYFVFVCPCDSQKLPKLHEKADPSNGDTTCDLRFMNWNIECKAYDLSCKR
jgi:hypothetical protein